MKAVRAAWLRGGTSKGLFFRAADVPPPGTSALDALVLSALGSPDPSGLQLNGLGGGISSTSKVAIVSKSQRQGFDVNYYFGQVEVRDRRINWEGSCGNLAAGVGLFALAEELVRPSELDRGGSMPDTTFRIRVWQENQGYGIVVHVPLNVSAPLPHISSGEGAPASASEAAEGDATDIAASLICLAGVPGREPPVYVELLSPHGDRPLLPTRSVVDQLMLPCGRPVDATLVTAGNPTVFVPAEAAGLRGTELPSEMDYNVILPVVEHLRAQASPLLGVPPLSDQPRVAFVAPPSAYQSSDGKELAANSMHLSSRISTPGRMHHAHTGTGSIALACAARIEGSVPWRCIPAQARPGVGEPLRIGHPGGVMEVRAEVDFSPDVGWRSSGAGFERTARYLMRGEVYVPTPERAP